jgi:hypothetical protein
MISAHIWEMETIAVQMEKVEPLCALESAAAALIYLRFSVCSASFTNRNYLKLECTYARY